MYPLVLVIWEDARTMDGGPWVMATDIKYEPYLVHQVGFLLKDEPTEIIITQAVAPGGVVAVPDSIPRGMVREIRYLKKNYKCLPPKQ